MLVNRERPQDRNGFVHAGSKPFDGSLKRKGQTRAKHSTCVLRAERRDAHSSRQVDLAWNMVDSLVDCQSSLLSPVGRPADRQPCQESITSEESKGSTSEESQGNSGQLVRSRLGGWYVCFVNSFVNSLSRCRLNMSLSRVLQVRQTRTLGQQLLCSFSRIAKPVLQTTVVISSCLPCHAITLGKRLKPQHRRGYSPFFDFDSHHRPFSMPLDCLRLSNKGSLQGSL